MLKRKSLVYQRIVPAIMVVFLVLGALTAAQAAPNFKGRVIKFIIPSGAGGGTDAFARMIQLSISKYIPGEPNIVLRNMPAAGGTVGANYAFNAKPDGRTVFICSGKNIVQNNIRPKGADFRLEEMYPIYSAPIGSVYYIKPGLVEKATDLVNDKGVIFGHEAATNSSVGTFIWTAELLGFKIQKWVLGYDSSNDSRLAFLSGELNSSGGSTIDYNNSMPAYVKKGEAMPIFQSGIIDEDGEVVREPAAPDVPSPRELYKEIHGKEPSGMTWEACKFIIGTRTYGKAMLLPPGTPEDIIRMYQEAAKKMIKDPTFLKYAAKLIPGAPHFVGEKFAKVYPKGVKADSKVIDYVQDYLTKKFNVAFD